MPIAALPHRTAAPARAGRLDRPIEPVRALTAVRGLAAWWVVGFHFREALPAAAPLWLAAVLDRGYLAVDLFFVLSGYVIALNYAPWFTGAGRSGGYWRFLALRLSRIYPLHLAMLLAFLVNPLAVVLLAHHAPPDLRAGYFGLSLLLVQAWGFADGLAWNVPAWSISAEWLAYLAFPILAATAAILAATRAGAVACIAVLLGALAAVAAIWSPTGLGYDAAWFGLTRCLSEFSVGICLCALGGRLPPGRAIDVGALWLAAGCIAAFALQPVPDFAIMPLCFACLVLGLRGEGGALARALRWTPLQWLGLVSYSTYLSHYLIKIWVKFALVRPGVPDGAALFTYLAVALLASAVLHRWIERPGQRMFRGLLSRPPAQVPT